jgi:Trk K+ transport system NAD-binding subunit
MASLPRWLPRSVRAQVRDTYVLLLESRVSLLLFLVVWIGSATAFAIYFHEPDKHPGVSWGEALWRSFTLIFFGPQDNYPDSNLLRVLYFVVPIAGLLIIVDGILRFGVAFFDKQARGQKWQVAVASTYENHIIVCGLGKVGFRTTMELLKFKREVIGIESNNDGRFLNEVRDLGIPVLIGDASRPDFLEKAGIRRADAIVPATDNELANLDIALTARELNPKIKVVLRMFDPDLARRVEKGFGIHTAFSVSALAAPVFAAAAMRYQVRHSFYVGDVLLNLAEFTVEPGCAMEGWSVQRLEKEVDASVVTHHRDGSTEIHPEPQQTLCAGDTVLMLATIETLGKLGALSAGRSGSS